MASFQGTLQCRVCEAHITVAATRNGEEAADSAETKASIHCPICESTVSFDAPGDINLSSVHVMGFEHDAEAFKRRPRPTRMPQAEGD